jgi:hypothetical protein
MNLIQVMLAEGGFRVSPCPPEPMRNAPDAQLHVHEMRTALARLGAR